MYISSFSSALMITETTTYQSFNVLFGNLFRVSIKTGQSRLEDNDDKNPPQILEPEKALQYNKPNNNGVKNPSWVVFFWRFFYVIVWSRQGAMFLSRKPETLSPVFRPDPETSPFQAYMKPLPEGLWTTGICECYADISNCLLTLVCPCITMGRNSEIINKGEISCRSASLLHLATGVVLFGWIFGSKNRANLRQHFSLPESPMPDWAAHLVCMWCALCQEHRELTTRGADPTLGWEANLSKWIEDGVTPPIVVPRMEP